MVGNILSATNSNSIISKPSVQSDTHCEKVWQQKLQAYTYYVGNLTEAEVLRKDKMSSWSDKLAYDLYEPEWICDLEKRVGIDEISVGDGPKFVCGPELLQQEDSCLVYSIGSSYNFQFEEGMKRFAPNCEYHTFDGTMNLTTRPLPEGLREKGIFFHNWNLGTATNVNARGMSTKTIKDIIDELHHAQKKISVFKIDCEGCEYSVLPQVIDLVASSYVAIDQIQVEMHGTDPAKIQALFQTFRKGNYMVFHKERNHWGCNGYLCVEYAFISKEAGERVFRITHCPSMS